MSEQRAGDVATPRRHWPAGSGNGSSRGVAGVFPVPLFPESGGSKRRRASRAPLRCVCRMANAALQSLNWMAGASGFGRTSATDVSVPETTDLQDVVRARAMDLAVAAHAEQAAVGPDAHQQSDEATLIALLRNRGSYNVAAGGANNLASFDPLLVALPDDLQGAPAVADILPPDEAQFLKLESRMLRPEDEQALIGVKPITPYVDPKLKGSRRMQVRFARQLLQLGLFRPTLSRQGIVGVFFVKKKNGSQRLILDCRPTNERFRKPPSTPLATAECLSSFEIGNPNGPAVTDAISIV